ncbi:MAG: ABC transporter ATP-binding protein [Nocardioidaceae bacterium]|nr:MAG: ABC transporter ATP-binding protein [Nocardioidaceae bacterium]
MSDLVVRFGENRAVDEVCLSVPAGTVLAVLGPSGCGKTTLLRAIAGLERPSSGVVSYDGQDLTATPTHRRGFALMFQDGQLLEHRTVTDNIAYPLRLRRVARREITDRVDHLLELVGLVGYGDRLPGSLSGGERQRVALARALAAQPRLLLLDEPLSALDKTLRERLGADLRAILVAAGTTALLVTHDHEEAFAVADRMALMRAGRIVQEGTLEEVWARPADPETALFLGYRRVLSGTAADRLLAMTELDGGPAAGSSTDAAGRSVAHSMALRRSALVVDADGPLRGRIRQARLDPEQLRLVVVVEGIGEVDAVASITSKVAVGEDVRLRVDPTRLALL